MSHPSGIEDKELLKRLQAHPKLRACMETVLHIVEDPDGDIELADMAEQRLIEEMRKTGHVALTEWAERRVGVIKQELDGQSELRRAGKKTAVAKHLRPN